MKKNYLYIMLIFVGATVNSCIEEIDFETQDFEGILVIEGNLTNEVKNQQVIISRTFTFEEEEVPFERNANVRVVDIFNTVYTFNEVTPGVYESNQPFGAQPGNEYKLQVTTSGGRNYESGFIATPQANEIDNVYAVRENNNNNEDGVFIFVDSFDETGNSRYYRFEYEETYRVIAPFWQPLDLVVTNAAQCEVDTIPKMQEERVCYGFNKNLTLDVLNTNNLSEDRIQRHPVRFISKDDYILTHRYSILVKQFITSDASFNFYNTLNNLSASQSLFAQNQPGFIFGNIFSTSNTNEKVLGFFDVTTVSEQRIFFNFNEIFANTAPPEFVVSCDPVAPDQFTLGGCGSLIQDLLRERVKYLSPNENPPIDGGPFKVVLRPCGDCTALGSNVQPDFWED